MSTHYFTLEEANALLPQVESLVAGLLAARQRVLDAQPELWPVLEKAIGNGGSKKAGEMVQEFNHIEDSVRTLGELGCILKDINTGLVDFPTIRHGRVALLCWRYGEPEIGFWHDTEAGFADRRPL